MSERLKRLQDDLAAALKAARDIAAKAEDENRDFTAEERGAAVKAVEDIRRLKNEISAIEGDDALRKSIADLGDDVGLDPDGSVGGRRKSPDGIVTPTRGKSIGQTFVESAEYKAFMAQFPTGQIPEKARVQSLPVGFKAVITGADDGSAGAFVNTDFTGIYEGLGRRPLTVRDIVSKRNTTGDTVEFVRQLTRVNAAAPVPEATSTAGSGVKPEGGFTFEKVTATVKTIAEWVPATKRAISDAAQLRGLIDQELRDDLREQEEDQILTGDGTGENLTGILETTGRQAQAWDTDLHVTTRRAKTKVRTIGRSMPTAYLLNPEDWERIDLLRDGENRFYGAGPFAMTNPTLWGLPVVESEAVPVGTGLVGDFRRAVLWDREQASITVSDSHADFFVRNLIAVLAEERLAFGVTRPSAFVEIDLTAA